MTIVIDNAETSRLAEELAQRKGVSAAELIGMLLAEAKARELEAQAKRERKLKAIASIQQRVSQLPILDPRSPLEIDAEINDFFDEELKSAGV